MRTPRAGTVQRAVFDAMHERWCGPSCGADCRQWNPDEREIEAAIQAVRQHEVRGESDRA